LIDLIEEK